MSRKLKKIINLFREFGLFFSIKWLYYKFTKNYDKYIELNYSYLCKYLSNEIIRFNSRDFSQNCNIDKQSKKYVWICWWQGYENMPELCKLCYNQVKSVLDKEYELILITKDNYNKYSEIPNCIIKKVEDNKIPITQFSDILRESLLYQNGGVWIDASIWCTEDINAYLDFSTDFWSPKLSSIDNPNVWGQQISQCKWGSFLLAGRKESLIFEFVFKAMCKYFEEHDFVIDYFLQNLLIKVAYENITSIQQMINDVPVNNEHIYALHRVINEPFDLNKYNEYKADTAFFKLTQKCTYSEYNNGQKTFYRYLKDSIGEKNG